MGESLSSEFWGSHGLPFVVFPRLEFAEKVHPIRRGLETLTDCSNGKSSKVRRRNASPTIPRVEFLQKRSKPRREDAHRSGIIPTVIQNSDGGEVFNVDLRFIVPVGGHRVGLGLGYGGYVLCSFDHTEGGTEGKVANNIEREVVVPWKGLNTRL